MSGIALSSEEVALIMGLLAALVTPIGVLFWALRASYLDRIADAHRTIIRVDTTSTELRPAIERLTEVVRQQTALIERFVDRREARR